MPPFVLTVLKFAFLALLYYFVYRAIRVAVVAVGERRPGRKKGAPPAPRPKARRGGREPGAVVLLAPDGKKQRSFRLTGTVQIGRAEACQIRLDDTYVSQFHARLFSRNGAWFVEDLGSTNGTYLNQQKVTAPTPVSLGDRLKVGKAVLELRR
ncbi:MAG TPA: FHA domain-containing protein [Actinomycetota bacterium]|nr:FHA domain-containing protein [Actinomycetota bacterium]